MITGNLCQIPQIKRTGAKRKKCFAENTVLYVSKEAEKRAKHSRTSSRTEVRLSHVPHQSNCPTNWKVEENPSQVDDVIIV
jgi:hypothetical protein